MVSDAFDFDLDYDYVLALDEHGLTLLWDTD